MLSLSYDIRDRWGGWEDQQIKNNYYFLSNFVSCRAHGGSGRRSPSPSPCFFLPISSEPTLGLTKWYQSGDPPTAPPTPRRLPPSRPFFHPSEAKPIANHATKNTSFHDADVAPCLPGPDRHHEQAATARCCVPRPPPTLNLRPCELINARNGTHAPSSVVCVNTKSRRRLHWG
jgi:hypothetical protein